MSAMRDEPTLVVDGEHLCSLGEFAEANADSPETVAAISALEVGQLYQGGGGAGAEWTVERIA